jgi:inosine-uridine nucleoside N-ribohydrolase
MREIVILIPDLDKEQNVEIDVRINGRKRTMQYRVELLDWEGNDVPPKEKVQVLRHTINAYNKNWELVEIGPPTEKNISLMFRKRTDPDSQLDEANKTK